MILQWEYNLFNQRKNIVGSNENALTEAGLLKRELEKSAIQSQKRSMYLKNRFVILFYICDSISQNLR